MIWLLIVLISVVLLFCYFIFAPFYLEINSRTGLYRIRFHRMASVKLLTAENPLSVEFKIAGWSKNIDLSQIERKKESDPEIKTLKTKRSTIAVEQIAAILKSFKVNKLHLSFCTENMPLNAILYPLGIWLSKSTGKNIEINFYNKNELILEIENNFFRIIRAYIHSKKK